MRMKFTSITFALFFLIVYLLYWNLKDQKKLWLLIVASLCFYSAWSPYFGFHFFAIGILNYFLVSRLHETRSRGILYAILALDLGNLFFFKYFYFFLDSLFLTTGWKVFEKESFDTFLYSWTGQPSIVLPLAISFYTFVLVAYAVDTYNGKIPKRENFTEYMTFLFYFPHLVAGPIIRHSDFFHQLKKPILFDREKVVHAIYLILQGLLKKMVIADTVFPLTAPIYSNPQEYDWVSAWIAAFGYSVRVYCDFSGYTDIARGLSKLLGLELPENFLAPYLVTNVRSLWRRWHYTLSTWIRDYIYVPLGGSRLGETRSNLNLMIAFLLGGLWHGANYTFLVWGLWNGVLIAFERNLSRFLPFLKTDLDREMLGTIRYSLYLLLGFLFTTWVWLVGLVFFNSDTIQKGFQIMQNMHNFAEGERAEGGERIIYMLIVTYGFNYLQKVRWEGFSPSVWGLVCLFAFGFLSMLLLGLFTPEGAEFIYFQF